MYAMTGKLTAHVGKRNVLIEVLLQASDVVAQLPGCRAYTVSEEVASEVNVLIFEIWRDKEAHDASLKDDRVRSLIAKAMPLITGTPDRIELKVMGGYGIGN